jgi:hypothetical protein
MVDIHCVPTIVRSSMSVPWIAAAYVKCGVRLPLTELHVRNWALD